MDNIADKVSRLLIFKRVVLLSAVMLINVDIMMRWFISFTFWKVIQCHNSYLSHQLRFGMVDDLLNQIECPGSQLLIFDSFRIQVSERKGMIKSVS